MADNEAWDDVCEIVGTDDFFHPNHRLLFSAMATLVESRQPMDALTLAESLNEGDMIQVGGLGPLINMITDAPIINNVRAYAEIVRDKAIIRKIHAVGQDIMQMAAQSGESPQELLDQAESLVYAISDSGDHGEGPVHMDALLSSTMSHIDMLCETEGGITGISTGFTELDSITTGLKPGNLVIVAGRPAMGKSALMMNMAEAALLDDVGCVPVFSLEMSKNEIMLRMLAGLGRVDLGHLLSGEATPDELMRIATATGILHHKPLMIDDSGYLTPALIRARCRRIARQHGKLAMIVVDYLQLMTVPGKGDNKQQEVSEISRQLKALAKEFKCPVVAGSQLNRGLEARTDKRPLMSDLRESGAIEQDADLVLGLYRDEVYHAQTPDRGIAEVLILKQRNGPIGRKKLAFLGHYTRFEDCVPDAYSEYGREF